MTSDESGFTLLETLLVLAIVCILCISPILKINMWTKQQAVKSQLLAFERLFEKSHHSAVIEGFFSYIEADAGNQLVTFTYHHRGRQIEEQLILEDPLSLVVSREVQLKANSGSPSKLVTFMFYDQLNKKKISYVVELGSAKLFKYEEDI